LTPIPTWSGRRTDDTGLVGVAVPVCQAAEGSPRPRRPAHRLDQGRRGEHAVIAPCAERRRVRLAALTRCPAGRPGPALLVCLKADRPGGTPAWSRGGPGRETPPAPPVRSARVALQGPHDIDRPVGARPLVARQQGDQHGKKQGYRPGTEIQDRKRQRQLDSGKVAQQGGPHSGLPIRARMTVPEAYSASGPLREWPESDGRCRDGLVRATIALRLVGA
jgi:hypothetical protein